MTAAGNGNTLPGLIARVDNLERNDEEQFSRIRELEAHPLRCPWRGDIEMVKATHWKALGARGAITFLTAGLGTAIATLLLRSVIR